ncbi:hypothetical protein DY000_02023687 [Brassica cretica]|uniref:Uncharacterized protein n=1 Tax=Brassica cretica TaxID=69181 RepID=A0ABQ7EC07_BRACR|nr:hypothetical protein DY000_02023687 [Brassica cretica]
MWGPIKGNLPHPFLTSLKTASTLSTSISSPYNHGVTKRLHGPLLAEGTGVPLASPRAMILTRQSPSSISIVISV